MHNNPVVVVITYQAQSGKGDIALQALAALIAEVVEKEPACLGIRLHQQTDDDTRFLLYELWTDRAAYSGPHMQTLHIRTFIEKAGGFMAGAPEIVFWQLTDDRVRPGVRG
jgi:quinol monooxygenase YgiN